MTKPPRIFSAEWKALHNWETMSGWQKFSLVTFGSSKKDLFFMAIILFLVLNGAYSYKHDMSQAIKLGFFCNDASKYTGFMPEEFYSNVNLEQCNKIIQDYNKLKIDGEVNISKLNISLITSQAQVPPIKTRMEKIIEITKIALNNSLSQDYVLDKHDCTEFSKDLIVLLNESGYSVECVLGTWNMNSHTWVNASVDGEDIYVEATTGDVYGNDIFVNGNYRPFYIQTGKCL